jgi:hypothetical protein
MSPHQTIAVGVRVFALWIAFNLLMNAMGMLSSAKQLNEPSAKWFIGAVVLLTIVFALFLWFFSRTVARLLLPGPGAAPTESASPDTWFAIGCSLLGLWVLTGVIPSLARYLLVLFLTQRSGPFAAEGWHTAALRDVVEPGLGFWLLLGAKGIRQLVLWARTTGVQ